MSSHRVVKVFDVIADQSRRGQFTGKAATRLIRQQLGFEGAKKAFRDGVVQTFSFAAHAGLGAGVDQQFLKQPAGVLAAAIAVIQLWPLLPLSCSLEVARCRCGGRGKLALLSTERAARRFLSVFGRGDPLRVDAPSGLSPAAARHRGAAGFAF